ncbi:MarR family transcriptional regulator [Novosphingobium sp. 9]|uniref:MarR family transcriptional regulator n=1 Tax=Novosphingobium sp. 9 TaxID=2025349 RepID=UPI0021B4F7FC|nr:MarR family transcriptional regulator [Novosphingobium sp. 9]
MYSGQREFDQDFSASSAADFAYGRSGGGGGGGGSGSGALRDDVSVAIFADRAALRATLRDDLGAAGLAVRRVGSLDDLLRADCALSDVVLVDCPAIAARNLAALCELDMRAAQARTQLIVSTNAAALDDVFACFDQSCAQILVDPDRAERVLALGRVLAAIPKAGVRELSEDDRLMILRLTEQVGMIAGRIENLAPGGAGDARDPARTAPVAPPPGQSGDDGLQARQPALPEARVVRRVIRQRQLRGRFIDAALFADPAWDMLLDLTAARAEGGRVSVTSLCIAAAVPPTTALRWIGQMVEAGLFVRTCDDADRRRAFIELSDSCAEAMARYFVEIA